MVKQTGSQSSFRLLRCPPSRLSAAGFPRLLAPSHKNAEIYRQTLALAETLKHIINAHTLSGTSSLRPAL